MLLRSSSTPVLGSLVPSSISESHTPTCKLISCSANGNGAGSQEFRIKSCQNGLRRIQSDGNLEEYLVDADDLSFSNKLGRSRSRRNSISCSTMSPIPASLEYDYDDDSDVDDDDDKELELELQDTFKAAEEEEEEIMRGEYPFGGDDEGKMYLATGLGGGSSNGGSGGGSYQPVAFDKGGGMEQHYKKMLEEDPGNSLLLRNYAHFLYQVKGDGGAAEEYYSRAILADEGEDGEILSQYAKLIWELHRDKERAGDYFQRAVEASSDNSHIHAAYASFLWDTEDEVEEAQAHTSQVAHPFFHHGFMASATA
ncbi:hypothetical protein ACS0TY_007299 [Phlomoides rotata]